MGSAIAARLAGAGHEIMVWNRSADKARATGFKVAGSPSSLSEGSEAVISILADAAAVESVFAAMLQGDAKGRLFIEMSTVRPAVSRRLSIQAQRRGAAFVECPVGGTIGPAKEGKLFGFVGGAPDDVARARPLLEQMCRRVEHVGPVGAGASMKLAINLPLIVYWQALGEAISLVKDLGLDAQRLMDILADTSGAPSMMKNRAPAVAAALAGRDNPVTVNIDTLKKDLGEMVAEAHARGFSAPLTERALECFERASRSGLGARDCTALPVSWGLKPQKL
jgi:3-hydroxyisobutyrate dehydrogenase